MKQGLLFYPCLAMLVMTALVMLVMFRARKAAVKSGDISTAYFKTYDNGERLPRKARQAERCFHNLLESTPVFYFVCVAVMALDKGDMAHLVFAWIYVLCRALQSTVHLTTNKLLPRASLYGVSWIAVLAIGIRLAFQI